MRIACLLIALAFMVPGVAAAAPPAWTVVADKSSIEFTGVANGNRFNGRFAKWAASIRFDPKTLGQSKATVVIDTASAKTGDNFQETTLQALEWFNITKFPTATFVATRISSTGPGRYVAEGVLTVKNKSVPVKLPFTLTPEGQMMRMQGKATVDRVALDLGAQSDASGQWVSKDIAITINLLARRGS